MLIVIGKVTNLWFRLIDKRLAEPQQFIYKLIYWLYEVMVRDAFIGIPSNKNFNSYRNGTCYGG
jgi:hypothetical protein